MSEALLGLIEIMESLKHCITLCQVSIALLLLWCGWTEWRLRK